jgi:hypothetical protein
MAYSTSVTASEVLGEAPFNANQVDATSEPVSTADLTEWIGEAEGILSAICDAHGITLDDTSAVKVADRGVKAFTLAQALRALGMQAQAEPYWDEWLAMKDIVEKNTATLGEDYDAATGLPTNVDTSDPKTRRWAAWDTDRKDGWTGW